MGKYHGAGAPQYPPIGWKTEFELEGINIIFPSPELEILEIQSRFLLAVMKGKFVKNIEVPINIFISTCKNLLDEAMLKVERAELLRIQF